MILNGNKRIVVPTLHTLMNQMDVNPIINRIVFLNPFIMPMDSNVNKTNSRCECDICGDSYIITAIYTLSACIHFFKFPHFGSNECSTAFDNIIINDTRVLQHAFVHKHTHFLPAITLFVHHLSSHSWYYYHYVLNAIASRVNVRYACGSYD